MDIVIEYNCSYHRLESAGLNALEKFLFKNRQDGNACLGLKV